MKLFQNWDDPLQTTITNKPHNNEITQYPLTNIQRILTSQEAHVPSGN